MSNEEIVEQLNLTHREFTKQLISLDAASFHYHHMNKKWNAGQQLEHIIMSVLPLTKALQLPHFILVWLFGKSNRTSKTYEQLVAKYQSKLQAGGAAPAKFLPKEIAFEKLSEKIVQLHKLVDKLIKQTQNLNDKQMDTYILPHPLLGKITLHEMLFFTVYHVQHHHKQVLQNLSSKN